MTEEALEEGVRTVVSTDRVLLEPPGDLPLAIRAVVIFHHESLRASPKSFARFLRGGRMLVTEDRQRWTCR